MIDFMRVGDWVVPILLAAGIHYLQRIALEIKKINEALIAAVTRVEAHEQRLDKIEERVFDWNSRSS